ncbi:MAG: phosphoglycerate dehydrogenase [Elusimicrobium sp.]|jgi:D-3-phosphoglycerate dehydrogenase|nr:phosphoglycerate dehydrogenase [Elusimicrobium sp.]
MKILIADSFPAHWQEVLKEKKHEIIYQPKLDENTLPAAVKDNQPEIIIVRSTKVNAAAIDACGKLKLIIRAGAGYDTIDVKHAKEKGVAVCNCPGTNSIAVAELTLGLILALDRRIYDNTADLRAGVWDKTKYSKARGIYGRTIGIIGLGHIGREVAKRAEAFGMKILGFDPFVKAETLKGFNITMVDDLYKLAAQADILTVHVPNNAGTKNLFDEKFFNACKDGAYFINAARGGLVKESALVEAAGKKGIRAGLDVYEIEPADGTGKFEDSVMQQENIYGTHHIGASTDQAQDSVSELAVKIIDQLALNGSYLHQVN